MRSESRKFDWATLGDGGYVMLDDFAGVTAALSFGIDVNCSWDMQIAERGINVYPAHAMIRNFVGFMIRKLSVTSSQ